MSKNVAHVYAAIKSEREAGHEYARCLRALAAAFESYTESLADGLTEDARAYETAGTENATAASVGVNVARDHYRIILAEDAMKTATEEYRAAERLRYRAFSILQ